MGHLHGIPVSWNNDLRLHLLMDAEERGCVVMIVHGHAFT